MALYDDVTEFATRGVDAAFPARRIARLAALAKSENSLKSARGDDPEVFNKAIQIYECLLSYKTIIVI